MSSLPPMPYKEFPADSLEKQIYKLVDSLEVYIPIANDRNRLSYNLYKFMTGEGDVPIVSIKNSKIVLSDISVEELALKIEEGLQDIKR
jgi:hypothetical protein